jgi:hypothetical protein
LYDREAVGLGSSTLVRAARSRTAPKRIEIAHDFGPWLKQLQFHGQAYKEGRAFETWGIIYSQTRTRPAAHEKRR